MIHKDRFEIVRYIGQNNYRVSINFKFIASADSLESAMNYVENYVSEVNS